MLIVFDVVGTLFSLDRVREQMREQGLPPEMLPWWFARLLQTAMAATLANRYLPFRQAAQLSLTQVLTLADRPASLAEPILESMKGLDPWPDADTCVRRLRSEGHRLIALTNSSLDAAEGLLRKAGLREGFESVVSADEAGACKPDPRPYRLALEQAGGKPAEACMVAAHGWDIVGADAAGMRTVWIERLEKRWTFPGGPPGPVAASFALVPEALGMISF